MFRFDVSSGFIAVESGSGLNGRQAPGGHAVRAGSDGSAIDSSSGPVNQTLDCDWRVCRDVLG